MLPGAARRADDRRQAEADPERAVRAASFARAAARHDPAP
jgi:hypothetical protein